jgi:hypothetical protein
MTATFHILSNSIIIDITRDWEVDAINIYFLATSDEQNQVNSTPMLPRSYVFLTIAVGCGSRNLYLHLPYFLL